MKIKTGFISNSSTTSFIIMGLELTLELQQKLEQYARDNSIDCFDEELISFNIWGFAEEMGLDLGIEDLDDERGGIGSLITRVDSEEGFIEYEAHLMRDYEKQISKLLEITGVDRKDIQLIMGCEAC